MNVGHEILDDEELVIMTDDFVVDARGNALRVDVALIAPPRIDAGIGAAVIFFAVVELIPSLPLPLFPQQ